MPRLTQIQNLPPDAAKWLRDRIRRDVSTYFELRNKTWSFVRNRETYAFQCHTAHAYHHLLCLMHVVEDAGRNHPEAVDDVELWTGDGI